MQYVSGGISFLVFLALVRWGLHLNWPLAVITGAVCAVAAASLVVAARDRELARSKISVYTWLATVLTDSVALLGVKALDLPTRESTLAAGILVLAVGVASVALGMLGAVAGVKPGR